MRTSSRISLFSGAIPCALLILSITPALHAANYTVRSSKDGAWSNPQIWQPARIPNAHDQVLVQAGTRVVYDLKSDIIIPSIRVAGTLSFARDRDTLLNVGSLRVQPGDDGDGAGVEDVHKDHASAPARNPAAVLEIGTAEEPIPTDKLARIRLHYLAGADQETNPALVCRPGGRMEIHGAPMNRTWVKLGANAKAGTRSVALAQTVTGWRAGDHVVITGGPRADNQGASAEERTILSISGTTLNLDKTLQGEHWGEGEYRSEIANLSRTVIIESADPEGVRGHTMYHWGSKGSISYARFAHLGKKNTLGRYPIHFHRVEDTMRGSSVIGAAIVDSHNRWITVHGTYYMVVRDCVGYQSVGHGFFLEDGTEVYNVLDRNLAIQAGRGPRMKNQALPFDPNDGAGFWWANGKNTFIRNVSTENEEYGYRYDCQMTRSFDCRLPIRQPNGDASVVDVRTIPIWRFDDNEAHTEGFYGMVVAANGNSQPDTAIHDDKMLARIRAIDWTGPDSRHPHTIRNLSIWNAHYAFRPHSPNMLMENVRLHNAAYGIYRPAFENHSYKNLYISHMGAEPFNRGMDDASAQTGSITVDGLTFEHGYGNRTTPLVQISDNNLSGSAATHFRRVTVNSPDQFKDRWPLINRGVGPRVSPMTPGVPIYIHDYFGEGRHAKVISTAAKDLMNDGGDYKNWPGLTGDEAKAAEVTGVEWPKLLDPTDDEPPATIVLSARRVGTDLVVRGVTTDNGRTKRVVVNGVEAKDIDYNFHQWEATLEEVPSEDVDLVAYAEDMAGNIEQTPHRLTVRSH